LEGRAPGYGLPDRFRPADRDPAGPPQVAGLAGQQIGGRVRPAPICCVLKFGRLANLVACQIWRASPNLARAKFGVPARFGSIPNLGWSTHTICYPTKYAATTLPNLIWGFRPGLTGYGTLPGTGTDPAPTRCWQ
jgi:hypothetical protein